MKTEDKRKFLYIDDHAHVNALNFEAQGERELKKLVLQIDKILGVDHSLNYLNLFSIGVDYLIEVYRKEYLENLPLHLNFSSIVENQTNVKLHHVQKSIEIYNSFIAPLGKLKPSISEKGILISAITPEKFKRYLNPNLNDYYIYLKDLLELTNQLTEYIDAPNSKSYLVPFVNNQGLIFIGNELKINNQYFADAL